MPSDQRRHQRHAVDLDCQVTFLDGMTHARARDLSFGGARIELPLHAAAYDMARLIALHIEDVGLARVQVRWHADRMVGLEFSSPNLVHKALSRVFAKMEPGPPGRIRPTGG